MAKILIVDDSGFMRIILSGMLQNGGHQVSETANGKEGIKAAKKENPDCTVLDMFMPEMDGVEVLPAMQSKQTEASVIGHTVDIQSTKDRCLELGAKAFLYKPYSEEELLQTTAIHCAIG